ncbi:MAG: hypothetical protein WCU80_00500 [Paludibacteraceae bacterium]
MSDDKSKGGALSKMKIISYKDIDFTQRLKECAVMVNPTEYSDKMGIKYKEPSTAESTPTYSGYSKDILSFKFVLDASGAIERDEDSLPKKIEDLKNTVYTFIGDTHEPPYIRILWGSLNYCGRMREMNITYKMFDNNGEPIRAEVNLFIIRFTDIETVEKKKNASSPDLSHLFLIKSGDSLPKLCLNVYGSIDYVDEVARINGLSGFRKLEPGRQLLLPPLSNDKNQN